MLNTDLILNGLVPALRSGEFRQVNGQLRMEGEEGDVRYCCLGVACEFARKNDLVPLVWNDYDRAVVDLDSRLVDLPDAIRDLYGFSGDEGVLVTIGGKQMSLAGHNDAGRTFDEIADALVTYCTAYNEARSELKNQLAFALSNLLDN